MPPRVPDSDPVRRDGGREMAHYGVQPEEGTALTDEIESDQVSDNEFRSLVEGLPVAVLVTDPSCERAFYANPACLRLWGAERHPSFRELVAQMPLVAADPELVSELWVQRRSLPLGPDG